MLVTEAPAEDARPAERRVPSAPAGQHFRRGAGLARCGAKDFVRLPDSTGQVAVPEAMAVGMT
jgi:hypothetical protein